jgi:hypothetical protein
VDLCSLDFHQFFISIDEEIKYRKHYWDLLNFTNHKTLFAK